jgi:hypothetical protein
MMQESYVPLQLRSGWVLEKYLGWEAVESQEGRLKLLRKAHGPLRRWILLARGLTNADAAACAARNRLRSALSSIVIVDMDGRTEADWMSLGISSARPPKRRTFGVGTFVIDLKRSKSDLQKELASRTRRMLRRAEAESFRVQVNPMPSREALEPFWALYPAMASSRSLQIPAAVAIDRMAEAGDLLTVTCHSKLGAATATILVYVQHDTGFFLYGARAGRQSDGASHLVHWEAMTFLQERGYRWYDFGQVPSCSDDDGLYVFKREFGGLFVGYGSELSRRPVLIQLAERAHGLLSRT